MPEGPEVRRYAASLARVLESERIVEVAARTKNARAWIASRPDIFCGRRVSQVRAHGKNLYAQIEGGFYFYSHLMMWGRWTIEENTDRVLEHKERIRDRRERARISTQTHHAILLSAPVFEVGEGQAREQVETLKLLGPDILPYEDDGDFDEHEFLKRLLNEENTSREIGSALLDQTICAGIGNYLRAEMLFECKINPWTKIDELSAVELRCLCETIPGVASRAYEQEGVTVDDESRQRMREDASLVYTSSSDWGTRHYTFRRTNLPCLRCGDTIKQKRQVTRVLDDGDKTRIIYFCPTCQNVPLEEKPKRPSTRNAPRKSAKTSD